MDIDAFEMLKNSGRTNNEDWFRETPVISYGVITKVLDDQTVEVDAVVQDTEAFKRSYTVTLLSLSSSLFEVSVQPKVEDLVLLLFLQKYNRKMFDDPRYREEITICDPDAAGYTMYSGAGILMRTLKAASAVTASFSGDGEEATLNMFSYAKQVFTQARSCSLIFANGPGDGNDNVVKVLFDEKHPYDLEHWARTHRQYGMREDAAGNFEAVDAAVNEEYSIYSPIKKDIQGTQDYKIGIGKDGDTPAQISISIGAQADIILESKSALTTHFVKDVTKTVDGNKTETVKKNREETVNGNKKETVDGSKEETVSGNKTETVSGDREENVTGKAKYTSADTDITSTAPVGINDGLYKSALKPYFDSETQAATALKEAATNAALQLAILDGMSGGAGFIVGLGAAIVSFCTAAAAMDTAAHTAVSKAVK